MAEICVVVLGSSIAFVLALSVAIAQVVSLIARAKTWRKHRKSAKEERISDLKVFAVLDAHENIIEVTTDRGLADSIAAKGSTYRECRHVREFGAVTDLAKEGRKKGELEDRLKRELDEVRRQCCELHEYVKATAVKSRDEVILASVSTDRGEALKNLKGLWEVVIRLEGCSMDSRWYQVTGDK